MYNTVYYKDLKKIKYDQARAVQEKYFNQNIENKLEATQKKEKQVDTKNYLFFCEHPHVYTLGKSGKESNLLINNEKLKTDGISFFKTNRGGDITYHGPGQVVGYPILDLDNFFTDIHKYMRFLEEVIIKTIHYFGIKGERLKNYTGVWVEADSPEKARKICAMGVKCSRWITMHGFALNVNTDLSFFKNINPCGITNKKVTSIEKEINKAIDLEDLKDILKLKFCEVFNVNLQDLKSLNA